VILLMNSATLFDIDHNYIHYALTGIALSSFLSGFSDVNLATGRLHSPNRRTTGNSITTQTIKPRNSTFERENTLAHY